MGHENFLFSKTSIPALGSTQPPIFWVPVVVNGENFTFLRLSKNSNNRYPKIITCHISHEVACNYTTYWTTLCVAEDGGYSPRSWTYLRFPAMVSLTLDCQLTTLCPSCRANKKHYRKWIYCGPRVKRVTVTTQVNTVIESNSFCQVH